MSRVCTVKGCSREGTRQPCLSFAAVVQPDGPRATVEIGLLLCGDHATTDRVLEIVDDNFWQQLCRQTERAGYATPDRATLQIEFRAFQ